MQLRQEILFHQIVTKTSDSLAHVGLEIYVTCKHLYEFLQDNGIRVCLWIAARVSCIVLFNLHQTMEYTWLIGSHHVVYVIAVNL